MQLKKEPKRWGRPRPGVDKIGEVDSKSHSATQQPDNPPSYGGRGLFSGFYRRTNMCISHTSITSIINDCFPSAGFFSLRVGTAEVCINASRKKVSFDKSVALFLLSIITSSLSWFELLGRRIVKYATPSSKRRRKNRKNVNIGKGGAQPYFWLVNRLFILSVRLGQRFEARRTELQETIVAEQES